MADIVISTLKLYKTYTGKIDTPVLFDINIEIKRGSFTALIGPSGSGKSTLLNCLGLLDPQSSGEIKFDGKSIIAQNVNELADFRNNNIGFIFQFHYLLPEFTSLENILMPYWIKSGKPDVKVRTEALRLMERIGIDKYTEKYPGELSGGQQQRVSIARALINKPKVIFADEPTGNLDREAGNAVLELMKEINKENNITLVMVTHDREVAVKADFIYELVDGKICRRMDMAGKKKEDVEKAIEERSCRL